jgi:hypothetical protein
MLQIYYIKMHETYLFHNRSVQVEVLILAYYNGKVAKH